MTVAYLMSDNVISIRASLRHIYDDLKERDMEFYSWPKCNGCASKDMVNFPLGMEEPPLLLDPTNRTKSIHKNLLYLSLNGKRDN